MTELSIVAKSENRMAVSISTETPEIKPDMTKSEKIAAYKSLEWSTPECFITKPPKPVFSMEVIEGAEDE